LAGPGHVGTGCEACQLSGQITPHSKKWGGAEAAESPSIVRGPLGAAKPIDAPGGTTGPSATCRGMNGVESEWGQSAARIHGPATKNRRPAAPCRRSSRLPDSQGPIILEFRVQVSPNYSLIAAATQIWVVDSGGCTASNPARIALVWQRTAQSALRASQSPTAELASWPGAALRLPWRHDGHSACHTGIRVPALLALAGPASPTADAFSSPGPVEQPQA
jgi:hypothetical protein